jgi:hypothetical protein
LKESLSLLVREVFGRGVHRSQDKFQAIDLTEMKHVSN